MDCTLERIDEVRVRCTTCGQVERTKAPVREIRRTDCGASPEERLEILRTRGPTLIPLGKSKILASRRNQPQKSRGLGDFVAAVLSAIGIRKRGGCGACAKRQAKLNRLGSRVASWFRRNPKPLAHLSRKKHRPTGSVFIPTNPIVRPTSDRLVLTIATGREYRKLLKITRPTMEAYARRIGADFVALTDTTQGWPLLEKFRAGEWLPWYERMIYLDADCIVSPDCPDLFDIVPAGSIGAHNDWGFLSGSQGWFRQAWVALMRSQGLDRKFPAGVCQNSGVIVCDREHLAAWTPPAEPMPEDHIDEQSLIQANVAAAGFPVKWLSPVFNFQYWFPGLRTVEVFAAAARHAHVVHLANCPARLRLKLARQLTKGFHDAQKAPEASAASRGLSDAGTNSRSVSGDPIRVERSHGALEARGAV